MFSHTMITKSVCLWVLMDLDGTGTGMRHSLEGKVACADNGFPFLMSIYFLHLLVTHRAQENSCFFFPTVMLDNCICPHSTCTSSFDFPQGYILFPTGRSQVGQSNKMLPSLARRRWKTQLRAPDCTLQAIRS